MATEPGELPGSRHRAITVDSDERDATWTGHSDLRRGFDIGNGHALLIEARPPEVTDRRKMKLEERQ